MKQDLNKIILKDCSTLYLTSIVDYQQFNASVSEVNICTREIKCKSFLYD